MNKLIFCSRIAKWGEVVQAVDRKTEILDAFMRLVSRFGVDKTTMQDIAKEVGISVGVIYKDFKNKEELIEAYFNSKTRQFVSRCQKLSEKDLPPDELLHFFIKEMFGNIFKMTLEDLGFWQFCQDIETIKVLHKNYAKYKDLQQELLNIIARIMEQGVQGGFFAIEDIPTTAQLFLKAFDSYWKEIFILKDWKHTLQGVDLMYGFVIKAIQTKPVG